MNFLEQLAAEWYAYKGYFVRTNVKFGAREKGGWQGEIDVLAFQPVTGELVHIECSSDAERWSERVTRFEKKFNGAAGHYEELIGMRPRELRRVAIVGLTAQRLGEGIEHKPLPRFLRDIHEVLANKDPMTEAVPETFPLLRAIQFAGWYAAKGS